MNLAGFRKTAEDKKSVTMAHPSGHEIKIAKGAVSALQRKQLERLPVQKMADGGAASAVDDFVDQDKGASIPSAAPDASPEPALSADKFSSAVKAQDAGVDPNDNTPPDPALSADKFSTAVKAQDGDALPEAETNLPGQGTVVGQAPSAAAPPASAPKVAGGLDLTKSYNQGQRAIVEQQKVASDLAAADAKIQTKDLVDRQALNDMATQNLKDFTAHKDDFANYVKSNPIDPKHYQENMSTGAKVSTAIGLLLGGFTGGFNKTGVNPAADW